MSEHPKAATRSTNWDSTTADTHNKKLSLNYRSINKQPRSLNFPTPLAIAYAKTILLTKTTAEQNEVALSYHIVGGLYFLAVVLRRLYTIYKLESVARCILQLLVKCLYLHVYYNNISCKIITDVGTQVVKLKSWSLCIMIIFAYTQEISFVTVLRNYLNKDH